MKKLDYLFLLIISFPSILNAQTIVGGPISSNTTWDPQNNPYIVQTTNVAVMSGATLTILPGVEVKFESQKAIQVSGTLRAIGTQNLPITFTSNNNTPNSGDWGYILFNDGSSDYDYQNNTGSIMKNCIVEYSGGANISDNGVVRINAAHPYIDSCSINNNSATGIYAWGLTSNLEINYCSILNSGGGIYAAAVNMGASCKITNCTIENNDGSGIYAACKANISNNSIRNNSSEGLYISYANHIVNSNILDNNYIGIESGYCNSCRDTIINNTITNSTTRGIFLYDYTYNSQSYINNNNISFNSIGIDVGGAYHSDFGSALISSNIISNNENYGINIYSSIGGFAAWVFDNIISNSKIGIQSTIEEDIDGFIQLDMRKNIISNNSQTGVKNISNYNNWNIYGLFFYCDSNIIADNGSLIGGSTEGGIYSRVVWRMKTSNNSIINNIGQNNSAIYALTLDSLTGQNNTIAYNTNTGTSPTEFVWFNKAVNFNNNNICNNTGCNSPAYDIWNAGFQGLTVNAQNSFWCSTNNSDILNRIWDYFDDQNLGIVDHSNYLSSPNTSAPVIPPANLTKTVTGNGVTLSWSANSETDLLGYKVYWGAFTGYSFSNVTNVGNVLSYFIPNISINEDFAITAIDNLADGTDDMVEGHESWFTYPTTDPCDFTIGIENLKHKSIVVYPNPNSGYFNLEVLLEISENIQIDLRNTIGQIIYTYNEKANSGLYKKTLYVNLEQGIYFLSLQTNDDITTKKIEIVK